MISTFKLRSTRRPAGETGPFGVTEVTVALLIVAIFLAIAVPLFLGARASAQDGAAQGDLRNAFTAARTYYTGRLSYAGLTVGKLATIEPSITFQEGPVGAGGRQVSFTAPDAGTVVFAAWSATSTCWYMVDAARPHSGALGVGGITRPGNWYAKVDDAARCAATGYRGPGLAFRATAFPGS